MAKGITKLKNLLEGLPETQFTPEEYMRLYTTIYNMCTQKPPHPAAQPAALPRRPNPLLHPLPQPNIVGIFQGFLGP